MVCKRAGAVHCAHHPGLRGFTRANLFRMRQFYETYRQEEKVAPLVRQLPWSHNIVILGQTKRSEERAIPNFGERFSNGETISTAFVESTINQFVSSRFVKKQSMQWTLRGAHLLLQTRTKVLNDELDDVFRR